jgi:hypothetical protein
MFVAIFTGFLSTVFVGVIQANKLIVSSADVLARFSDHACCWFVVNRSYLVQIVRLVLRFGLRDS